jgi:4-amino-4-deoxy-L-arabinose transferase-like glycosyltransferase
MQNYLNKRNILLSLLFILSFFLRLYKISEIPSGFFCDEAAIGYNAYKLLTTGRDEYGKSWPVFFRSFGDFRTPIPIYSNILSVAAFGLNEFAVRFTTVIYGTATVLVVFFLAEALEGTLVGFASAFLLGISPWHIHLSRWGSEYTFFSFFFALGLLWFIRALGRPKLLLISFAAFGLALYTYYSSWIVTPVFMVIIVIYWITNKKSLKNYLYLSIALIVFFIIFFPLLKGVKEGYALTRWQSTQRTDVKPDEIFAKFEKYYTDHFGGQFLFLSGDIGYPGHFITRHSLRGMGELYMFQLILVVGGMLLALVSPRREWLLIYLLLFIYPLPGSISLDGPSATRSIIGVLPLTLFSGFCMGKIISLVRRSFCAKVTMVFLMVLIMGNLQNYLWYYYAEYPKYSSDYWGWQWGPKDIIKYFITVEYKYDELYYSGEANAPQIFLPFYTIDRKLGCRNCYAGDISHRDVKKKQLFVASPGALTEWGKRIDNPPYSVVKNFFYPNGEIAFQAVEYSK